MSCYKNSKHQKYSRHVALSKLQIQTGKLQQFQRSHKSHHIRTAPKAEH